MEQNSLPTIYDAARACSRMFDNVMESEDLVKPRDDLWREIRGRFGLWISYAGVFAPPKACLDARLGGYSSIKDMVLELLEMVQSNLQWGEHNRNSSAVDAIF